MSEKANFVLLLSVIAIHSASSTEKNSTQVNYNVLGGPLDICSINPLTGWFRDGFCRTDDQDHGLHVVCATMTKTFLEFTKSRGNDLSTKRGSFPGLSPGDRWCLCASRWREAMVAKSAPLVVLKSTHKKTLEINTLEELKINQVTMQHIVEINKEEL